MQHAYRDLLYMVSEELELDVVTRPFLSPDLVAEGQRPDLLLHRIGEYPPIPCNSKSELRPM